MKKLFILLLLIPTLACTTANKKVVVNPTEITAYEEAENYLKNGIYYLAAEKFENIEENYPFTKEAEDGLVMAAYSHYKAKDYEDSLRVIDYFLISNPISVNSEYMYYLRGLNYFSMITNQKRGRDVVEKAQMAFRDLLVRYPNSIYRKDVYEKIKQIRTILASNEMMIGRYYESRFNYIGASSHFLKVIANYPESIFVPEAYYRMIEVNKALGLDDDAEKYLDYLKTNYKNNRWTRHGEALFK